MPNSFHYQTHRHPYSYHTVQPLSAPKQTNCRKYIVHQRHVAPVQHPSSYHNSFLHSQAGVVKWCAVSTPAVTVNINTYRHGVGREMNTYGTHLIQPQSHSTHFKNLANLRNEGFRKTSIQGDEAAVEFSSCSSFDSNASPKRSPVVSASEQIDLPFSEEAGDFQTSMTTSNDFFLTSFGKDDNIQTDPTAPDSPSNDFNVPVKHSAVAENTDPFEWESSSLNTGNISQSIEPETNLQPQEEMMEKSKVKCTDTFFDFIKESDPICFNDKDAKTDNDFNFTANKEIKEVEIRQSNEIEAFENCLTEKESQSKENSDEVVKQKSSDSWNANFENQAFDTWGNDFAFCETVSDIQKDPTENTPRTVDDTFPQLKEFETSKTVKETIISPSAPAFTDHATASKSDTNDTQPTPLTEAELNNSEALTILNELRKPVSWKSISEKLMPIRDSELNFSVALTKPTTCSVVKTVSQAASSQENVILSCQKDRLRKSKESSKPFRATSNSISNSFKNLNSVNQLLSTQTLMDTFKVKFSRDSPYSTHRSNSYIKRDSRELTSYKYGDLSTSRTGTDSTTNKDSSKFKFTLDHVNEKRGECTDAALKLQSTFYNVSGGPDVSDNSQIHSYSLKNSQTSLVREKYRNAQKFILNEVAVHSSTPPPSVLEKEKSDSTKDEKSAKEELNPEITKYNRTVDMSQSTLSGSKQLASLRRLVSTLQTQLTQKTNELKETAIKLANLEAMKPNIPTAPDPGSVSENTANYAEALKELLYAAEADSAQLRHNLETSERGYQEEINRLQSENILLKSHLRVKEKHELSNAVGLQRLQEDKETNAERLLSTKEELKFRDVEIADAHAEIAKLKNAVSVANEKLMERERELEAVRNSENAIQGQLRENLDKQGESILGLANQHIESWERELEKANFEIERNEKVISALREELRKKEEELYNLNQELEAILKWKQDIESGKVASLVQREYDAEAKVALYSAEMQYCRAEKRTLDAKTLQLEEILKVKDDEIMNLRKELYYKSDELTQLSREVGSIKFDLKLRDVQFTELEKSALNREGELILQLRRLEADQEDALLEAEAMHERLGQERLEQLEVKQSEIEECSQIIDNLKLQNDRLNSQLNEKEERLKEYKQQLIDMEVYFHTHDQSVEVKLLKMGEATIKQKLIEQANQLEVYHQDSVMLQRARIENLELHKQVIDLKDVITRQSKALTWKDDVKALPFGNAVGMIMDNTQQNTSDTTAGKSHASDLPLAEFKGINRKSRMVDSELGDSSCISSNLYGNSQESLGTTQSANPLDIAMNDYIASLSNRLPFPITKHGDSMYAFGSKIARVLLLNGKPMVENPLDGMLMSLSSFIAAESNYQNKWGSFQTSSIRNQLASRSALPTQRNGNSFFFNEKKPVKHNLDPFSTSAARPVNPLGALGQD